MAKGYLEKRLKELGKTGIEVSSAGIAPFPGMEATEEAKQVTAEEGGDISGHCASKITEPAIRESDLIFAMETRHKQYVIGKCPEAEDKTYLLKDFKKIGDLETSEDPNIVDPSGKHISFYRKVFSVIKESVERLLKEI